MEKSNVHGSMSFPFTLGDEPQKEEPTLAKGHESGVRMVALEQAEIGDSHNREGILPSAGASS